jgi:ABC-2 type transport system ATP-binding protein
VSVAACEVVGARAVSRRFGDFVAVDRVDLSVAAGEVVGLIGANGAGKTTLITMLLGLLAPTSGTVRLFGAPPALDGRRRIGYVPQHLGLYADLSVTENLAFRAAVFGVDRAAPRADDGTLVADLPLGRQRIAAFRAALQHAPELLVLDEPTSGVSPLARSELWDLVREQAETGVAVLVSTHHMDEAVQADRLLVMAQGRVVATGTVDAVVGDRRTATVDAADWAAAFAALDGAGLGAVLSGRSIRIPGHDIDRVRRVVSDAGVDAAVRLTPATLDETMVELSR